MDIWRDTEALFKRTGGRVFALDVAEPPCKRCQHFSPRVCTDAKGDYAGVVLCTRIGEMCNDFSCYRPRDAAETQTKTP